MLDRYYQRELSYLRELATEFAAQHPGVAPLLAGQSNDPDVERILEGTAFLSGLVHEKLDDEFPEIIHGLMELIFPHYLRPLPSATLIEFTPKPSLREKTLVPRGVTLNSLESEGTRCSFTTCQEVELSPVTIDKVELKVAGDRSGLLRIDLVVVGGELGQLNLQKLRFFLAGVYSEASARHWMIQTRTRRLRIIAPDGTGSPIPLEAMIQVGFQPSEALLPYPPRSFPGYRILQEFFTLPEKFLFFDVTGLEVLAGHAKGTSFSIEFSLADLPLELPAMRKEHIKLFVTPAVNLFQHEADPILLDHRQPDYQIRPSGSNPAHYRIHTVNKVTGFIQGTVSQREYMPFVLFNPQADAIPVYSLHHRRSPLSGEVDLHISVAYPASHKQMTTETLSLEVLCTNASLAETLRAGDINVPTESSPILADFTNLSAPTAEIQPPYGNNLLWRLLSHIFLNYQSIASADNLRAMLKLYIFQETRNRNAVLTNTKRVEAIRTLKLEPTDRFFQGSLLRGQDIILDLDHQEFVGPGDAFLFGAVLNIFFANYAAINCFTRLTVQDSNHKERFHGQPVWAIGHYSRT